MAGRLLCRAVTQPNPYAPPQADGALGFHTGFGSQDQRIRREGDLLVIPARGAALPHRCVVCNAAGQRHLRRKLYWHPQGYYALLFIGALFYVIAALIVRKSAEFELTLCDQHAARRRNGFLLGWLGFLACLIGLIALASTSDVLAILFGIGLFILPIVGIFMAQVIAAKRIDESQAWLKVGKPFLESF